MAKTTGSDPSSEAAIKKALNSLAPTDAATLDVPATTKIAVNEDQERLSSKLPEPTSYAGRNLIALNIEPEMFKQRPNQSLLVEFDGKTTYVDCGNPAHLKGGVGSMTIEAWIKPAAIDGAYRSIVSHGQPAGGGQEMWLRISHGRYEFGCWDGPMWGVTAGALDQASREFANGAPPTNMTVPVWGDAFRTVLAAQQSVRAAMATQILAKQKIDASVLDVRAEDIGTWVHIAGVYDAATKNWSLYRNGELLASIEAKAPLTIDGNWYIGGMYDSGTKKVERLWKGGLADVRMWSVARTERDLRANMNIAVPYAASGQLAALWRLQDGDEKKAIDVGGKGVNGDFKGTVKCSWGTSPTGEVSQLLRQQSDATVTTAFNAAKGSGLFDPLVFPRVRRLMSETDRQESRAAIAGLSIETFKQFYIAQYHLILQRDFSGKMGYTFVPSPPERVRPQLFIVEDYRLSSFLGRYGSGRTLKTFSLLPGETTKISIRTASQMTATATQATSILDSYSTESASEFESSLEQEQSTKSASSEEASFAVHAEGSCNFGIGSCSASADAAGALSSSREEFGKSVANATSKHASKASANRNVQIDTTSTTTSTTSTSQDIERNISNINVGRTLNFVFRQMNQEFISLLHLIDVRVGYTNGLEPLKEVPLYELNDLLGRVLSADTDSQRKRGAEIGTFILGELQTIRDEHGEEKPGFLSQVKDRKGVLIDRWRVNKDFTTSFEDPTTHTARAVPGIIISSKSIVMRTEDIVVDSLVGEMTALDEYAVALQETEIHEKELLNERSKLQNKLLEMSIARQQLLIELTKNKDEKLLKLFLAATNPAPLDATPSRIVSVWEGNGKGAATV